MKTRRLTNVGAGALLAAVLLASLAAPVAARSGRLADRPFVVVAVVDTGINPYHVEFRRPDLTAHPATYVEGFPGSARRLDLALGEKDLERARNADSSDWRNVETRELYWIPGTNIVGAIDIEDDPFRFMDTRGHGTAVASLAGGKVSGPPTDDVLIVAVNGLDEGLEWAAAQPWIDVITNSWSNLTPVTDRTAEASRAAVENGKVVCFASGNLAAPLWFIEGQGPSWHVNVGAASPKSRGEHYYTGYPNDVLGFSGTPAASHESTSGTQEFGGTSAATPSVCGLMATTLARARAAVGDGRQGPQRGALAAGRGDGAFEDGRLTRLELEDAVQSTAEAASSDVDPSEPLVVPAAGPAAFLRGGYGIVDAGTIRHALRVLLGDDERPARAMEDAWIGLTDRARDLVWGAP